MSAIKTLSLSMLLALSAHLGAEEMVNSYVDSKEGVAKDAYGNCWRTGYKDTADKKVECGYQKDQPKTVTVSEEVVVAPSAASVTTTVSDFISISAAVLFAFDSAELSKDGKAIISERVETYRGKVSKTDNVRVVGHTDSTGPDAYNQTLSERRAKAVADYLETNTKLEDKDIDAIGMGESKPAASNDTRAGRALNRRVDIEFLGTMQ